ncbi:tetratricopeptide repeat protein [Dokdonia sp.]|uniref:tetratricopeptide repeat-containing sensor histidine kinase n=1 Tax=Dokdonia sp. TaxID=2024995 RepID=UPI003263B160
MKVLKPIVYLIFIYSVFTSCKEGFLSNNTLEASSQIDIIDEYLNQSKSSKQKEIQLSYLDSAVFVTRELKNIKADTLKRFKLSNVARQYYELGIRDSFYNINLEIKTLSGGLEDSIGLAASNYNLGLYHLGKGKLDSAYTYFYKSENIYDNLNEKRRAARVAQVMAITQKNVKDYVGSESSSVKAIRLFESVDDMNGLSSCYNNLGNISFRLENYDDAIKYYQKAIEYKEKEDKNALIIAGHLNNIGNVYIDKKNFAKAISFFDAGLAYDSLIYKRPRTYARLLDNKAFARYRMGVTEGFPEVFLKPLRIRDSVKYKRGIVSSNLRIATIYEEIGDKKSSASYAQKAYDMSKEAPFIDEVLESLSLFMKVKDPKEGVAYGEEYIRISDSLQTEERAFQNKFARIRYETDKLEIEKNKATETSRLLIIIFSFVAILFLLGYIILQRRNARKELEYIEGQQQANEEIFNLMLSQQTKLEEGKHMAKQRISEELHDGILSRLFGLRLSLDSLNTKHGKEVEKLRSSYIDQLKDLGKEIRRISHDINDEAFSQDTLYPDVLQKLLNDQLETQDVIYQFVYDEEINWELVTNPKKVHIYRIIQECVMNINKHAKAEHITVTFKKVDSDIQLVIEDDGVGMDPAKAKVGIGMKNIKSRVAQIAGSYKVVSKINLGTQIQILFN